MTLSPISRRIVLTTHVASSVGWLGSVAGFLALSVTALTTNDASVVRSCYVAMNVLGETMIVPLSLAALATGVFQSLGTHWGLLKHYWVLAKFALTILATSLLLLHQFTAVAEAARRAGDTAAGAMPDVGGLGRQLLFDSGAAVVVLLVTTTLSVFKPWGQAKAGGRILLVILGAIIAVGAVIHLATGGMGRHH